MKRRYVAGLVGALLATATLSHAAEPKGALSAPDALAKLAKGNAAFVAEALRHPDQTGARRTKTAAGQNPFAIVLCCSDSRVPPEVLFDQGLGDLFVVRVAGNVADDLGIASIEYAAEHLGTHLVVVMGHSRCGAVTAAVKGGAAPGHLLNLMEALEPAVAATEGHAGDPVANAVWSNVLQTSSKLRESAPILSELVEKGKLTIVGANYDLDTGVVEFYDQPAAAAEGEAIQ
jgi:carbonic anhydrase